MTRMNLSKRLKRLEATVLQADSRLVFRVRFICPQRGLVRTLTLGDGPSGEALWEGRIETTSPTGNGR